MKNILYILIFILCGCNTSKNIALVNNFEVNQLDVENIISTIKSSNFETLELEKELFLKSKFKDDFNYLNLLNEFIDNKIDSYNNDLLNKNLNVVFKNIKQENINKVHVLYMQYSGEMLYSNVVTIVEEKGSYAPTMFYSGNNFDDTKIKFINESSVVFIEEYRLNLGYSFENKSLFNTSPQHFFISNIEFKDGKINNVKTTFKVRMLYNEKEILDKFLIDKE